MDFNKTGAEMFAMSSRISLNDTYVHPIAVIVYKKIEFAKSTLIDKLLYIYK